MGVLVLLDSWESFRSLPPQLAMVALVSNGIVSIVVVLNGRLKGYLGSLVVANGNVAVIPRSIHGK